MFVAGVFCLTEAGAQIGRYERFQHPQTRGLTAVEAKNMLGHLNIPRIGISTSILEGDTIENLALGAVHLSDTAALGSKGNAAIAAHRDLAFRGLGTIQPGDKILIHAGKDLEYRVSDTQIVKASDTSVLDDDGRARLTLITCYPFHYVGSAPQRFVVHAELR